MLHIREAVVTEGRYDRAKLSNICDALIVETNGFAIYNDPEKREYLKRLAAERGLVILTDSDSAGRQIRAYIASFIPKERIRHAYIPDIPGKERRKASPSREGKLGVADDVLEKALRDAGCAEETGAQLPRFSPADLYALGLTGAPDCAALRKKLLSALALPENLTLKRFAAWVDTDGKKERVLAALEKIREKA